MMAALGFRTLNEMIGRMDFLDMRKRHRPLEGARPRLLEDLCQAGGRPISDTCRSCIRERQDHGLDKALDNS
jgi:glutamate synthase (NADPH/NADH) large chain